MRMLKQVVCVEFTGMISGSKGEILQVHFGEPKARSPSLEDVYGDVESFFECGVFLRTQSEGSTSPFFLVHSLLFLEPNRSQGFLQRNPICPTTEPGFPSGKVYMSVVLPCTTWRRALPTAQMVTSVDVGGDVDLWGRKKNWHHGMPPWWDFLCFLVVFCFGKTSKCLQNDVDIWAMKKTWLVGLYRGWNTTQLSGDYNKPL